MKNSIKTTKYIMKMLKGNEELIKLVPGSKIYPIDAKLSSAAPFIVVERTSITPGYAKDGDYEDDVNIMVHVIANTYENAVDIASEVRRALELHDYNDPDGTYISIIELTGVSESLLDNSGKLVYTQELTFNVKMQ
jgi:hypothetical protein